MLRRIEVRTSEGWVGIFTARSEIVEYARPNMDQDEHHASSMPVWAKLYSMPAPYERGFLLPNRTVRGASFYFTEAGWATYVRANRTIWRELAKSELSFRILTLSDDHGARIVGDDWSQVAIEGGQDVPSSELYRHSR